jgi:polysaccharide lyase-like protein
MRVTAVTTIRSHKEALMRIHLALLFFSALILWAVPVQATVLINEDFNVATYADLEARGWVRRYNFSTTDIVSSPTHSGGGALRMTYAIGTVPDASGFHDEYNSGISRYFTGQDEIYERYYVRFDTIDPSQPSNFVNQYNATMKNHYFNDGMSASTSIDAITEFWYHGSSTNQWSVAVNNPTYFLCPDGQLKINCSYEVNAGTVQLGIGNNHWYCVETHFKANTPSASDGIIEVWVDGTQVTRYTNARFRDTTNPTAQFVKTFLYRQGAYNIYRYTDDYVLATTRVGCSGSPSANTTPPPAPTGLSVR